MAAPAGAEGEVEAGELEAAIRGILHGSDPRGRQAANQWLEAFSAQPAAWSAALALAFPPRGVPFGRAEDVRFFALNVLLSKVRRDAAQLSEDDSAQIFDALLAQLPGCSDCLRSRLCILVAAMAALAGPDSCFQLVERSERDKDYATALELLTALAEEAVLRARALPWEIGECMQECCPYVVRLLNRRVVEGLPPEQLARSFVCLARWQQAGVTLTEVHSEYPSLYKMLLAALQPQQPQLVREAAVEVLAELVAEVDLLPGRNEAVRATIAGVAAAGSAAGGSSEEFKVLVPLLTTLGTAEGPLLAQGGAQALQLLQWLVQLTAGGPSGRDLEGAAMAAEVWPRVAAVPPARRGAELQSKDLFVAVLQAVVTAATYSADTEEDEEQVEEFERFRSGPAAEALAACLAELGGACLQAVAPPGGGGGGGWRQVEAAYFCAGALSEGVLRAAGGEGGEGEEAANSFLNSLMANLPARDAVAMASLDIRLLTTILRATESYAPYYAANLTALEAAVMYALQALRIPAAQGPAASALRALCAAAAPRLAAARALAALLRACEEATAVAGGGAGLRARDRGALAEGLAGVALALPPAEAEAAVTRLAAPAVAALQHFAAAEGAGAAAAAASSAAEGAAVAGEVAVLAALVRAAGSAGERALVPTLQAVWPAVQRLAATWAGDPRVAAAVCRLWGAVAQAVGTRLAPVLPSVIAAASAMFLQHRQAACLTCLAHIVKMPRDGSRGSAEVEARLSELPERVAGAMAQLQQQAECSSAEKVNGPSLWKSSRGFEPEEEEEEDEGPAAALAAAWELMRTFIRINPQSLVTSSAFLGLCRLAQGSLRSSATDVAQAAAQFLAELIWDIAPGSSNEAMGALSQELAQAVNVALAQLAPALLEETVHLVALGGSTAEVEHALVDVARALCQRHTCECRTALQALLRAPRGPVRHGALPERHVALFVAAATREEPLPAARFHDLMADFARVAKGLVASDVFEFY